MDLVLNPTKKTCGLFTSIKEPIPIIVVFEDTFLMVQISGNFSFVLTIFNLCLNKKKAGNSLSFS